MCQICQGTMVAMGRFLPPPPQPFSRQTRAYHCLPIINYRSGEITRNSQGMGSLKIFPKTGDLDSVTGLSSRGSRVTGDLLLMDVKSLNPPIDGMRSHVKLFPQLMNR